ncbi:MAG: carbonic anhydrase [Spirochaetaceae bacterium]|nr:carbonic anhydrase [Spirochaetaceae bacterium]
MKKLLEGTVHFKKSDFEDHRELFSSLGKKQNPHTLFITCSDSRLVPSMITQTLPGELFIVRNVANLVPPYRIADEFLSTTAAIEYAVQVLKVSNIIVCGHSNCGGCALLNHEDPDSLPIPNTRKWMELAAPVRDLVNQTLKENDPSARIWLTEQINVLEQMKHLLTYPYISEGYKNGTLSILGWHYIINSGEIFQYNKEIQEFELLN